VGEHYELEDHRHNVAVWAAARAAQRGLKDFDVETAARAIEACGLRAISADWRCLPEPVDFDARHGGWCEKVARSVTQCSHGRAAKLVNMYLKLRVVCGPAGENADARPKVGAIHPPIDSQILKGLARDCRPDEGELRRKLGGLATLGWTKFDADAYQEAINAVRAWLNTRGGAEPLWRAEQAWRGY
jgi:hypothetical protein